MYIGEMAWHSLQEDKVITKIYIFQNILTDVSKMEVCLFLLRYWRKSKPILQWSAM